MSTRRSPSLSKNSNVQPPPAGGAFLLGDPPAGIFTPEDLPAEARLAALTMERFVRVAVLPARVRLESHEPGLLRALVREAGTMGLLAGTLPAPHGLGLAKTTLALLAEKSAADLSFAVTIGVHAGVGAYPLLFFGTAEQKGRYLPVIARGEMVAAFALTEANAGSDALAVETRAAPAAGSKGYVLDGVKLWVTNAGAADLLTVFAHLDGAGPTAFLVDRDSPGVEVGPEEKKLGLRASSTCRLMLNQAPAELLGEPGKGHLPALYALNLGRFQIGAIGLGGAKEALRLAALYAGQRRQQGQAIGSFGLIQQKLGNMAARIFALESMVYRVAGYWDARLSAAEDAAPALASVSEEYAIECALIKFFATEALSFAVDEALQIHGGYGFSEDYPIARMYRDCRVFRIFEGTNEINRLAVAQQIRRRIERGRLPIDFNTPIAEPPPWPASDDPVAFAGTAVVHIRHLLLAVLRQAWQREDQEIDAALADLCAVLFALESAWLRCRKITAVSRGAGPTLDMLLCLAERSCRDAGDLARTALIHAGAAHEEIVRLLQPLADRPAIDAIKLRRRIAQHLAR